MLLSQSVLLFRYAAAIVRKPLKRCKTEYSGVPRCKHFPSMPLTSVSMHLYMFIDGAAIFGPIIFLKVANIKGPQGEFRSRKVRHELWMGLERKPGSIE